MNRLSILSGLVLCLLLTTVHRPSAQTRNGAREPIPTKVYKITRDSVTPGETSLAERLVRVDAVLLVKVLGEGRARAIDTSDELRREHPADQIRPSPAVVTESRVQVLDVLKGHPFAGVVTASITVATFGGDTNFGDGRVISEMKTPAISPGGEYLLFLRYNPAFGVMIYNPFDTFRLDRARVETTQMGQRTEYMQEVVGRTPADALNAVREALTTIERGRPQ